MALAEHRETAALMETAGPEVRASVQIDHFGMAIGATSIGLPTSCTSDTILLRYLDLIRLVSPDREPGPIRVRSVDVAALARATGLDVGLVSSRLAHLQG